MRLASAAARLVKPGERQRRAQAPRASALLCCDRDGGLESFLGRSRVGWIPLDQDFAAQEMGEREIGSTFASAHKRQRPVDARQRAVDFMGPQPVLREQRFEEPPADQALLGPGLGCPLKIGHTGRRVKEPTPRADDTNLGEEAPIRHPVLSAERLQRLGCGQRGGRVSAIEFEEELGLQRIDRKYASAWTGQVGSRFLILSNELPRLADVSGALAGRFILLSLTESFYGREDPGLTDKLLTVLPGILNWAIAGWARLCEVRPLQTADVSGRGHAATRGLVEPDWRVRGRMLRDRRGVQR